MTLDLQDFRAHLLIAGHDFERFNVRQWTSDVASPKAHQKEIGRFGRLDHVAGNLAESPN